MTQYGIEYASGKWQVYATEDAIHRTNVGYRHLTPRAAAAFIDGLADIPDVSPLRARTAGDSAELGGSGDAHQPSEADRPLFASEAGDGFTPAAGLWDLPPEAGG